MFFKCKRRGMHPNSAHLISFAIDVSRDEIRWLIAITDERGLAPVSERLTRHRDALTRMHADFSATSENLEELADQTDAIASDIADIERLLERGENEQSFHCGLASSRLRTEAMIARSAIG